MDEEYQLRSLNEAAQDLNLSIFTMRSWVFQKKIPFVRLGRRILIRRSDLKNLIDSNLVEPRKDA